MQKTDVTCIPPQATNIVSPLTSAPRALHRHGLASRQDVRRSRRRELSAARCPGKHLGWQQAVRLSPWPSGGSRQGTHIDRDGGHASCHPADAHHAPGRATLFEIRDAMRAQSLQISYQTVRRVLSQEDTPSFSETRRLGHRRDTAAAVRLTCSLPSTGSPGECQKAE